MKCCLTVGVRAASLASAFAVLILPWLAQAQTCVAPPAGLVSWWQAESNAYDSVQLALGTPGNNTSYVAGKVGLAFAFDGTLPGVQLGNPNYLQLQNFTIEGWIRRSNNISVTAVSGDAVFFGYGGGGYAFGIHTDGRLLLEVVGGAVAYSTAAMTDTNFHHVAVACSNSIATFFIDGVPNPLAGLSGTFSFGSTCSIGSAGGGSDGFLGDIAELSVYDRPLTSAAVQSIFNAGSAGKCLAPEIVSEPANQVSGNGSSASFSVLALGGVPLSYQWLSNGVAVPGGTNASLSIPQASVNNNGDHYSVTVSNSAGAVESSTATLTVGSIGCEPPPSGIVSWWQAESNAYDSVQLAQATLAGGAGYAPGKVGLAFSFNGNSSAVNLGDPAYLQLQAFTIEGWVRRNNTTNLSLNSPDGEILGWGTGGYAFGIHSDGTLLLSSVGNSAVYSVTTVLDTNYHHVAVTFSGGVATFYVDGDPDPPASYNTGFSFGSTCSIGASAGSASVLLGNIDELSFYNRVLTPLEIATIFRAGSAGKCLAPVIVLQPASVIAPNGQGAAFSVAAAGSIPLSYQWLSNGVAIASATSTTFALSSTSAPENGVTYSVTISNPLGSIESSTALLATGNFACVPPPAGMVGWWQAESNAYDAIHLVPGSLIGNVGYVPGKAGLAFSLSGNASINLGNPSYLQLQSFTIEGWIQRSNTAASDDSEILGYGGNGYAFGIHNDGRLLLSQVGNSVVYSEGAVTDTNFHHVAVTLTNGVVVFYVDGAPEPLISYSPSFSFGSTVSIGASASGSSFFAGNIDELSVYNVALSPSQIQAIFGAGSNGKCLQPEVLIQPEHYTVVNMPQAFFAATGLGSPPLAYQWLSNGVPIPGATNQELFLPSLTTNYESDNFSVLVQNFLGEVQSSSGTVALENLPCAPAPSGMVSWWAANGNALDMTGNNPGIALGGVTYAPGEEGTAFAFRNSGDAVALGNPPSLQLQNFTIEAWVRRASPTEASPTPGGGIFLGYGAGGYGFGMDDGGNLFLTVVSVNQVSSQGQITDTNKFHHLGVTMSNQTVVFYIDGIPSAPISYGVGFAFTTPLEIGASANGAGAFIGDIDDLTVYNRALSPGEMSALYTAGAGEKCLVAPTIGNEPQSQAVVQGQSAVLSVVLNAILTPSFQWVFDGQNLPSATNGTLVLTNFQAGQAGTYSVVASNALGVAVSSNAVVTLIPNNPLITVNGINSFTNMATNSATVQIQSTFTDATIFYTLDGSEPDFGSILYTGPFSVADSSIIQAVAYDTNFNTALSPPFYLTMWFSLTLSNAGGGTVSLSPSNSVYPSGQVVQLAATPTNGWQFLQWSGTAGGANPVLNLTVNETETVAPVFGTTLNVIPFTNGSVQFDPPQAAYAYGSTVELSAVPNPGYFFGLWGGSVSGAMTPYVLQILSPTPAIAALFGPLEPGHFALTVIPNGPGTISPYDNQYPSNAVVSLTGTGLGTNRFYFWTGNANGTNNPITVIVNTNKIIQANFTTTNFPATLSVLSANNGAANFVVSGTQGQVYDIQASSNLINWTVRTTISNATGLIQFAEPLTNSAMRFFRAQSH